jgi:hypothetical protein
MSRREVKSLNDLAMAHGGQLTINPQTGLPEAGFLSAILPMVAGAALGPAGFGLTAMQAGLAVGAGSYLLNPKAGLMGGLMAGMGGYGGAGLGAGLSGLATSEAGTTTANAVTAASEEAAKAELIKQQALQESAKQAVLSSPTTQNIELASRFTPDYINTSVQSARDFAADSFIPKTPIPTGMDAMYQGAKSIITDPTADKFKALGGGSYSGLARMGLSAATPAIGQQAKFTMPETKDTKPQVVPHYKFTPGMQTPTPTPSKTGIENVYFKPQYTALSDEEAKQLYPGYGAAAPATAANGGLMSYAGGGPIEAMSDANAIGANTGFPQAYLHSDAYATPYQMPISQNVLADASDVSVDPYTGEQKMAEGGVSYDPKTQRYTGGIADAIKPENRDVNIYNDTGGPGSGGGPDQPLSPQTTAFFDNETKADRDARMQGISNLIGMAVPGYGAINALSGLLGTATAGQIANTFSPPGSQPNYGVPVSEMGSYAGNPMGQTSYESGQGNPAESNTTSSNTGEGNPGESYAQGGISHLGDYSDGGRLLRGPGDGVSDSIPAVIGKKQPARLADGEFVVPARIVSELGNGSTEAGARKLYAMMDRIQAARGKTVGKGRVAKNSRADKYLPA